MDSPLLASVQGGGKRRRLHIVFACLTLLCALYIALEAFRMLHARGTAATAAAQTNSVIGIASGRSTGAATGEVRGDHDGHRAGGIPSDAVSANHTACSSLLSVLRDHGMLSESADRQELSLLLLSLLSELSDDASDMRSRNARTVEALNNTLVLGAAVATLVAHGGLDTASADVAQTLDPEQVASLLEKAAGSLHSSAALALARGRRQVRRGNKVAVEGLRATHRVAGPQAGGTHSRGVSAGGGDDELIALLARLPGGLVEALLEEMGGGDEAENDLKSWLVDVWRPDSKGGGDEVEKEETGEEGKNAQKGEERRNAGTATAAAAEAAAAAAVRAATAAALDIVDSQAVDSTGIEIPAIMNGVEQVVLDRYIRTERAVEKRYEYAERGVEEWRKRGHEWPPKMTTPADLVARNTEQGVMNADKYPLTGRGGRDGRTPVPRYIITIWVYKRLEYLRVILEALSRVTGINETLLIIR